MDKLELLTSINFSNRDELINQLSIYWDVHEVCYHKIILTNYNPDYMIKIDYPIENHAHDLLDELNIYKKSKECGLDIFFEEVRPIGCFKYNPKIVIYKQRKLLLGMGDRDLTHLNNIIENWDSLYSKDIYRQLYDFCLLNYIKDFNLGNIGYNFTERRYKLFDYAPGYTPSDDINQLYFRIKDLATK